MKAFSSDKSRQLLTIASLAVIFSSILIATSPKATSPPLTPTTPPLNSALQNVTVTPITWQIYKNDKYGFEFQYPDFLEIKNIDNQDNFLYKNSTLTYAAIYFETTKDTYNNYIKRYDSVKYPKPTCKTTSGECVEYDKVTKESTFNIGGKSIKSFIASSDETPLKCIFFPAKSENVIITFTDEALSNQILSTFKFTDTSLSNIPKDWQKYKNTQYGFEFQYPKIWQIKDTYASSNGEISLTNKLGKNILNFFPPMTEAYAGEIPTAIKLNSAVKQIKGKDIIRFKDQSGTWDYYSFIDTTNCDDLNYNQNIIIGQNGYCYTTYTHLPSISQVLINNDNISTTDFPLLDQVVASIKFTN
jgi:hypothetical protein